MPENLTILIQSYLEKVDFGMGLFQQKIGYQNPLRAWHSQQIERTGNLSQTIQYELHGIGCTFLLNDEFLVDFDFYADGQYDGFDLWRLKQFVLECYDDKMRNIYHNINELENDFQIAVLSGELIPALNSRLFVLKPKN